MIDFFSSTQEYRDCKRGNISILAATLFSVAALGVAVSIDIGTAISSKSKTQDQLDAAVLNVTKFLSDEDNTLEEAQKTFNLVMREDVAAYNLQCDPLSKTVDVVSTNCRGASTSFFGRVTKKEVLPFTISSAATVTGSGEETNLEVTFVYDISVSMRNAGLLPPLEGALQNFTQHSAFSDNSNAKFSLIPYGGGVIFDSSMANLLAASDRSRFQGCFTPQTITSSAQLLDVSSGALEAAYRSENINSAGDPICPDASMTSAFFKEDASQVTTLTRNLIASQGTNSSEGLVWGYRSLHPSMRGVFTSTDSKYPLEIKSENKKILILMTDGKPLNSGNLDGKKITNVDERRAISARMFEDTCRAIKASSDNIDLYTIGFGKATSTGGEDLREFLEDCVKGNGKFSPATEDSLSSVISEILDDTGTEVSNLRLVR